MLSWPGNIMLQVTHLGYYEGEQEAARVYDKVAISLHGSTAQTNFPTGDYAEDTISEFRGMSREELQRALGVKPMDKSSKWVACLLSASCSLVGSNRSGCTLLLCGSAGRAGGSSSWTRPQVSELNHAHAWHQRYVVTCQRKVLEPPGRVVQAGSLPCEHRSHCTHAQSALTRQCMAKKRWLCTDASFAGMPGHRAGCTARRTCAGLDTRALGVGAAQPECLDSHHTLGSCWALQLRASLAWPHGEPSHGAMQPADTATAGAVPSMQPCALLPIQVQGREQEEGAVGGQGDGQPQVGL